MWSRTQQRGVGGRIFASNPLLLIIVHTFSTTLLASADSGQHNAGARELQLKHYESIINDEDVARNGLPPPQGGKLDTNDLLPDERIKEVRPEDSARPRRSMPEGGDQSDIRRRALTFGQSEDEVERVQFYLDQLKEVTDEKHPIQKAPVCISMKAMT